MPTNLASVYQICPHCGSGEVHLTVWTGLLERWVSYLRGTSPYQCRCCCGRFYRRLISQKELENKAV